MTALIDLPAVDSRLARANTVPSLADQIDALLPQTQCTQCGFDGCRPYAEAIAAGEAGIDRCPPGGERGLVRLATLLHRPIVPLDPRYGEPRPRHIAVIDERHCIGCTLCIQACPVDAIVGANKFMHTVLNDACSGCDLCIAPCPVDCISMQPAHAWDQGDIDQARQRHRQRNARLSKSPRAARAALPSEDAHADSCTPAPGGATAVATTSASSISAPAAASATADDTKRDVIAAALARARARRAASLASSTDSAE